MLQQPPRKLARCLVIYRGQRGGERRRTVEAVCVGSDHGDRRGVEDLEGMAPGFLSVAAEQRPRGELDRAAHGELVVKHRPRGCAALHGPLCPVTSQTSRARQVRREFEGRSRYQKS